MPAITFFAMVDAMRTLYAHEMIEKCDVQAISICQMKYYDAVRARYINFLSGKEDRPIIPKTRNLRSHLAPVFKAESNEAKYAMMELFARKKGMAHG